MDRIQTCLLAMYRNTVHCNESLVARVVRNQQKFQICQEVGKPDLKPWAVSQCPPRSTSVRITDRELLTAEQAAARILKRFGKSLAVLAD
jgi:hypothetical protein